MVKIQSLSKQVEVIGCMDNTLDNTFESANRVYGTDGLSSTINTCGGGGLQPKIVEVQKADVENIPCKLDKMPNGYLDSLENAQICDINTPTASTITARYYKGIYSHKDNMIIEQQIVAYDEQNKCLRTETIGTLTTDGSSPKHNNRVIESKKIKIRQATKNYYDFIYSEREINERYTIEILQLLRERIDEEEISKWAIRGLWCVLAKEILRQNVYAKSIFESWRHQPKLFQFSYYSGRNKQVNPTEKQVREMWEDWEIRCSSYRRKLEQQYRGKFDDFMQKLSYENSSSKEIVCYMWKTCKGNGILQQALSEVQEIWQSLYDLGESYYLIRIRKLVPKCCWRLMGFTDEDFHKAEAINSNTQLYKQAGNSIVENVLVAILGQLFAGKEEVYKNI